ncbi:MAG: cysteine--tRNA ligase [Betaproteobacteria bacterium]|nr:cysteine--tRNA ligase [Betaproteobacteria bacterium]
MKIFNTLSRSKRPLVPIEAGHVRMYVCGMTVYDYCHMGHARVLVVFDMVRRWLEASGLRVTYVRNITDIDDKIIARAVERNEPINELTQRFIHAMHEDCEALGVLPPTHEPRATEYVPQMISLIDTLKDKGLAYQDPQPDGSAGDVHFSVRDFPSYGQLSGKSLDELRAGERVAVVLDKRDPLDFVLWKRAKPSEPADAIWPSPYGPGRPGWHIECSAMSCALLGYHFDIHGGGADLQFPHHENEIAQSEGALRGDRPQAPYANLWMHNGFVRIDNEKMSKSLGNFFTIREVLTKFSPEVVRAFILRAHYRSPLNYSDFALQEARAALVRLYTALELAGFTAAPTDEQAKDLLEAAMQSPHEQAVAFREAMQDDFNTPEALAALFVLATDINRLVAAQEGKEASALAALLRGLGLTLGLLGRSTRAVREEGAHASGLEANEIEAFIAERREAKASKNFARADEIRKMLLDRGIVLEDSPQGTTWRRG